MRNPGWAPPTTPPGPYPRGLFTNITHIVRNVRHPVPNGAGRDETAGRRAHTTRVTRGTPPPAAMTGPTNTSPTHPRHLARFRSLRSHEHVDGARRRCGQGALSAWMPTGRGDGPEQGARVAPAPRTRRRRAPPTDSGAAQDQRRGRRRRTFTATDVAQVVSRRRTHRRTVHVDAEHLGQVRAHRITVGRELR
ncbi:MAG: hypothetical protein JWM90_3079 [Thermoleophilia bacterium]|nr:hypothetical protein [Thermoleophilia bacterium]